MFNVYDIGCQELNYENITIIFQNLIKYFHNFGLIHNIKKNSLYSTCFIQHTKKKPPQHLMTLLE